MAFLEKSEKLGIVHPSFQMAYEGYNVSLHCYSYLTAIWLKDDKISRGYMKDDMLLLRNVTKRDSGMYTCIGSYANKTKFEKVLEVLVGGQSHSVISERANRATQGCTNSRNCMRVYQRM